MVSRRPRRLGRAMALTDRAGLSHEPSRPSRRMLTTTVARRDRPLRDPHGDVAAGLAGSVGGRPPSNGDSWAAADWRRSGACYRGARLSGSRVAGRHETGHVAGSPVRLRCAQRRAYPWEAAAMGSSVSLLGISADCFRAGGAVRTGRSGHAGRVDGQGAQVVRSGEPRNPPPGQSAGHRDGRWRLGAPGTKAGRQVAARALPAPGYVRRRKECGQGLAALARAQAARLTGHVLRIGVSHAGR
jgi:hypothetical protein